MVESKIQKFRAAPVTQLGVAVVVPSAGVAVKRCKPLLWSAKANN